MPPFQSNDGSQEALFDSILNGVYEIPMDITISKTAAHFMSQLIKLEDVLRLTSEDALKHPWLAGSRKNTFERNVDYNVDRNVARDENSENTEVIVPVQESATIHVENLIDFGENDDNVVDQVASLPNSSELTLSTFSSEGIEQEVPKKTLVFNVVLT